MTVQPPGYETGRDKDWGAYPIRITQHKVKTADFMFPPEYRLWPGDAEAKPFIARGRAICSGEVFWRSETGFDLAGGQELIGKNPDGKFPVRIF